MLKSRTRQSRRGSGESCSTRGWMKACEYDGKVKRDLARFPELRKALDRMFELHARKMPARLRDGQELVTELDDESLPFVENVFLMTSCGASPSWEPPRAGRAKLWTLLAYPSSF